MRARALCTSFLRLLHMPHTHMRAGMRVSAAGHPLLDTTGVTYKMCCVCICAVLIHGFGAFGDQWRFNLGPLSEAGYTVYAPTLPGFGRSEKAALQYSQNAW